MAWPNYTIGPSGSGKDFTLISAWEATAQTDWGANSGSSPVTCEIFGGDYGGTDGALNDKLDISAWSPQPTGTNSVSIFASADANHNGLPKANGGTGFKLENAITPIGIYINHVYVTGIEIQNTSSSTGLNGGAVNLSTTSDGSKIERCIVSGQGVADVVVSTGDDTVIRNNLIRCFVAGLRCIYEDPSISGCLVQSNTLFAPRTSPICTIRASTWNNNGAINASGSAYFDGGALPASSNNASFTTPAIGSDPVFGVVDDDGVDFVSPSTGDYSPTDTGLLATSGADLSGQYTTDITGATRTGSWTIGAYIVAGGPPPVGIQEMYIKDGGIFVKHTPHVKVGGTFQEVDAYVLEAGSWVPVHEK